MTHLERNQVVFKMISDKVIVCSEREENGDCFCIHEFTRSKSCS